MKINHTSWKSVTLAVTASLLMSGGASTACSNDPRINTADLIAVQQYYLRFGTPLTGCRLLAADVAAPTNVINTADVVAIQRYVLCQSTGTGTTGTPGGCDILGNTVPP